MYTISFDTIKTIIRIILQYITDSSRIAFIMAAGDVLMQHYNGNNEFKEINWHRSLKFASIGLCFSGPISTYFENIFKTTFNPNQSYMFRILKQLFCKQIYLAPSINLGIMTLFGIFENESSGEIEERLGVYFPYIIKRYYMLWPGVELFGKFCIQPTSEIAFENFVGVFWFAYLSGILHKDDKLKRI